MTITIDNSAKATDDLSAPDPAIYQYDLKLEVAVKEANETVPIVAIFRDLITHMRNVASGNNHLVVLTATGKQYFEQKDMTSEEFQQAFHVDKLAGKVPKVMLGFKIRTMTRLSEIKNRLMQPYLKPHNLFLREHAGGFENGVKSYVYGYLKNDHPDHPDINSLTQRFARSISDAWKNMEKDARKKWRDELPNIFFGSTGIMLPMTFTKERITASIENKEKIATNALVVSTPAKYGKLAKTLLDITVLSKKINNLIPFALNREDPKGYYFLAAAQARFMETHRNIPISNVPLAANTIPGVKGVTLQDALHSHPAIQRVAYDPRQNKYHVSTTAAKFREVHEWITNTLNENKFPYSPETRALQYNGRTNISYASIFKDAMSTATDTYDESTIKTTTSNAWKTRPPFNISYIPTDTAFPPLPLKKSPPATPSTTTETLDEDTIQSAISAAIKKLEDQHKADLNQLRQDFQKKLDAVEKQMKELGKQVAVQTYQALVSEDSPLATKTDHEILRQDICLIKTQLTTLLNVLQHGASSPPTSQHNAISSPRALVSHTPPHSQDQDSKRTKVYTTPIKMKPLDDVFTQDHVAPSAASTPEEDMEGCEY